MLPGFQTSQPRPRGGVAPSRHCSTIREDSSVKSAVIALSVFIIAGPCLAQEPRQEPVGCDKFKWPIEKERATLTGTDLPKLAAGDHITWPIPWATIVTLAPFTDAKLPIAPEVAPKSPASFAGFLEARPPAKPGTYKITLSSEGWIDVVQDGHAVKSTAFSGALGCEGVRKSVKFDLAAKPFTVELSSVPDNTIKIAVSPE
jgi:hypothetical protein